MSYHRRRRAALELARAGDCAAAAPSLENLVAAYPDDSELWVDLGLCQGAIGERAAAVRSLQAALELGTAAFYGRFDTVPAAVMTRIAWLRAEDGDTSAALEWLERALAARYSQRPSLAGAPEAALFKGDTRFAELAGIAPAGEFSRVERWRYDIEFLRDQVAQLHFDPDHHTPAAELDRYLDELAAAASTLTDRQIAARLGLFMGRVGAGHDVMFLSSSENVELTPFAIRIYPFTDGVYVIDADDESLVGARIDAIGDVPTATAMRIFSTAVSRDNNMTPLWSAPRYLTQPDVLEALGLVESADAATLTITDRRGRRRIVSPARRALEAIPASLVPPAAATPLYLSRLEQTYWTRVLDDVDALYVQVNGLFDAGGETFSEFVERVGREAAAPGVKHLIVDVRHNAGGRDAYASMLLRAVVHFDMEPDKGSLYVLIGRNTFSAGQILITKIEALTDAVFVGEPSGSRPNFIGRTGNFSLPFSGLSGYISSEYAQSSSPEDHRIWTAPDVPVGLSSQAYFAGQDPAIRAIRRLLIDAGTG